MQDDSTPTPPPNTGPVPTREQALTDLRNRRDDLRETTDPLRARPRAGIPEVTNLVRLRKEDCKPLLVPADRVYDFAQKGWAPEVAVDAPMSPDWRQLCERRR